MRRQPSTSLIGSPMLIGAVTVLITLVAVFLAYNANSGLPFVPTYDITAQVPDAAGLNRGDEVRIGGARVGIVTEIRARETPSGPIALLDLKLDKTAGPLRSSTQALVRPRSPLGLKYVALTPGHSGRKIAAHQELPVASAQSTVDLDQVLNAFDASTRKALDGSLVGLGDGFAGRGVTLNRAVADAPALEQRFVRVGANLADPRTGLDGAVKGLDRTSEELAAAGPALGSFITNGSTTFGALASVSSQLEQTISEFPSTESTGTSALAVATPVLHDARLLVHDIRPGAGVLASTATELHAALRTGIPVVRRAVSLAGRLRTTLNAVDRVSADPQTSGALQRLLSTELSSLPTLTFIAPSQTVCNYYGLWFRNVPSLLSEGDASGTWLRTVPILNTNQNHASATPSSDLHMNPYPNTASPGQTRECEAGNEPYVGSQLFGNVPGNQGTGTELTSPNPRAEP
jgi:virulence factor Mce-like protein